jgi:hypothetical protein
MKYGMDKGRGRVGILRTNAAEFFPGTNNNDSKKARSSFKV